LRGKFDCIVETVNTAPYFILLFKGKAKGLALYHQLARDVWFFETRVPMSYIGYYIFEPLATWLLARAKAPLITISESTKNDLAAFGWDPARTTVISEGIQMTPAKELTGITKYSAPTMLSFGALRTMKRTLHQIEAFEIAKKSIPNLQLKIAGSAFGAYGRQVLNYIKRSKYAGDIEYLGRAEERQKKELMQQSHVIVVTSIKEGWGLIVTEAASQGTPAVVYDVDGLRDSVRNNETGVITYTTPADLAAGVVTLLRKPRAYESLRKAAWRWSKQMTFDRSYQDFKQAMEA
jgi:glycosyltransferase involved in cell wall biosynthesis